MNRNLLLLFLGLISMPVLLRFFAISVVPAGLYWDEMDLGYQAFSLLHTGKDYFGNVIPVFPHSLADFRTPIPIYAAVPFVKVLGLNALSTRLPTAVWSILGLAGFYLFLRFWSKSAFLAVLGLLALSFSPWHFQYARFSTEAGALFCLFILGLACFFRQKFNLAALLFGLSVYTYSPAKFFIPFFLLFLILFYFPKIAALGKSRLAVASVIFLIVCLPLGWDFLTGNSQMRFDQISIFSDPTLSSRINSFRTQSQQSVLGPLPVGTAPGLFEKIMFNKPLDRILVLLSNYLHSFSTEFLFISGDPQPRHSPGEDSIGMLFLAELIPLVVGLTWIMRKKFIVFWLLFSPLPAALTREGGVHAARLFLFLPPLMILVAKGWQTLFQKHKNWFWILFSIFLFNAFWVYGYYFSSYKLQSAPSFSFGFDRAISAAVAVAAGGQYDSVYVDFAHDSPLMAYIFYTAFSPGLFQSEHPLPLVSPLPDVTSHKFDNLYLLTPGVRFWTDLWGTPQFKGKNFIVVSSRQPLLDKLDPRYFPDLQTITYPDGSPAFYTFTRSSLRVE